MENGSKITYSIFFVFFVYCIVLKYLQSMSSFREEERNIGVIGE